jgi:serine/threonine protein kinase
MASSMFEPGHIIAGRYRVEGLLGQGAMGSVYRAVQLSVGRSVALKLLVDEHRGQPAYVQRFEREALALSRLAHPNTVRLFDFGTSERGWPFIVMELLRGSDLADDLERQGPLRWDQALRVLHGVASSLAEAHAMGIVHRDIKPANIFLCADAAWPTVKVLDFGIAGDTERGTANRLTLTGTVVGSAAYMSPEQAQGRTTGPASDLYGLGVVSFEALTARTPFHGRTFTAQLLAKVLEPAPRLRELSPEPDVPPEVAALVEQLLEREPSRRPASALALIGRIEELLARAPRLPLERAVLSASTRLSPPGIAKTEPMLVARTIDEGWSPPRTGVVASIRRDPASRRSRWALATPTLGVVGLALGWAQSAFSPELEASLAATTSTASSASVASSASASSTASEASAAVVAMPSKVEANALGSSGEEALPDSAGGAEWVRFEETAPLERDAARLPRDTNAVDEHAAPDGRAEAAPNAVVARPSRAPGARRRHGAPHAGPEPERKPASPPAPPEALAPAEASAQPAPPVAAPREARTILPSESSALPAPPVSAPRETSRMVLLPESSALPAPPISAPRAASSPVAAAETSPPLAPARISQPLPPEGTSALPEAGPLPAPAGTPASAPTSPADPSMLPPASRPLTDRSAPPLATATPPLGAPTPEGGAASAESAPPGAAVPSWLRRYPNVMAVRAALASGAITPLQRNRIVARLRERRHEARARAARDYQAGWISRRELRARQDAIEREFEGY